MSTTTKQDKKKLPITGLLVALFGAFMLAIVLAGILYLDYQSGSTSGTFLPNGMEVEAVARGFGSGSTSVGSIQGENVPPTILLRIEGREFRVTATAVQSGEEVVAKIPPGTKKLSIVSYRDLTTIEADNKTVASLPESKSVDE